MDKTPATPASQHDRFLWPPRPLPASGVEVKPAPRATPIAAPNSSRVGPPIPARNEPSPPPPAAPRTLWRTIEESWLGLTTPTFAERAADALWSPDDSDAYCPRCAATLGEHEFSLAENRCPNCRGKRLRWSRAVRLGAYEGLLRDAIHETKFTAWRRLGGDLGRLLGRQLKDAINPQHSGSGLNASPSNNLLIVPIPTTFLRRVSRGIDHTLVISRAVRAVTGGRIVHSLSRRHGPSQLSVPPSERAANIANTMTRRRGANIAGSTVVLIDDVMTTGATMREACRALLDGLPEAARPREVWIAVLGVTPH